MKFRVVSVFAMVFLLYGIQKEIDANSSSNRALEEVLYVENGLFLKKLSLGFENVAADLYWLRTVQYFGAQRQKLNGADYSLLEPLLRITTDLDPNFKIAYSYGATFLSEPFPMGLGMPSKGVEMIDRGIQAHPQYWRFYLDKGFIYYWHLKDYKKAAEVFVAGSEIEGAPYWMLTTAGRTLSRGGEREMSRELWKLQYDSATTEQQRSNAAIHLVQLESLDQIELLTKLAMRQYEQSGRFPDSWEELIESGSLSKIPLDPMGNPYVLKPEFQEVQLSSDSGLGFLPTQ